MLKYLVRLQSPLGPNIFFNALVGGHVGVITYLHHMGCPKSMCATAWFWARYPCIARHTPSRDYEPIW